MLQFCREWESGDGRVTAGVQILITIQMRAAEHGHFAVISYCTPRGFTKQSCSLWIGTGTRRCWLGWSRIAWRNSTSVDIVGYGRLDFGRENLFLKVCSGMLLPLGMQT